MSKKQRYRDEAPPDNLPPTVLPVIALMDCDGQDSSVPTPSYKDMLTCGSNHTIDDDLVSLDDDDIDLLEDDVQTGEADEIPFIIFSDRVMDLDIKSMVHFGLTISMYLQMAHGQFSNTILPLSPDQLTSTRSKITPTYILAWVRLYGLPITWYKRSLIEAIGARIGKVVKIDYQIDYGHRGRFARMAVKINLKQPIVSKIVINGHVTNLCP
ncbi:hypothetical protein V6N11_066056 [Hibiscus sabdariffa]|uniref:DUF4283 domain-containing protein n=1 Tax=Hibiscus sabdariffa TaxID=183260 RepID=A0ABR2NUL6_9ROSI